MKRIITAIREWRDRRFRKRMERAYPILAEFARNLDNIDDGSHKNNFRLNNSSFYAEIYLSTGGALYYHQR